VPGAMTIHTHTSTHTHTHTHTPLWSRAQTTVAQQQQCPQPSTPHTPTTGRHSSKTAGGSTTRQTTCLQSTDRRSRAGQRAGQRGGRTASTWVPTQRRVMRSMHNVVSVRAYVVVCVCVNTTLCCDGICVCVCTRVGWGGGRMMRIMPTVVVSTLCQWW
jgi:hypothetical protein